MNGARRQYAVEKSAPVNGQVGDAQDEVLMMKNSLLTTLRMRKLPKAAARCVRRKRLLPA